MAVLAAGSYGVFLWLAPPVLPDGFLYGNGQIEATEISVSAEIAGKVLESNLIEGRAVNAGDVLVRLDETDLRLRLAQAEAQVQAAASTLAQVEQPLTTWRHHLDVAVADLKRYRTLSETGTVSAQAMERAQNQEKEARGQVGALQAQQAQSEASLEVTRHEVELVRSQVSKTVIHALAAGTILSKGIEVGELAMLGRTITVLADLARIELKIYIP